MSTEGFTSSTVVGPAQLADDIAPRPEPVRARRGAALELLRGEWTKLRSLRASWVLAGAAVLLGLGTGLLATAAQAYTWLDTAPADRTVFDPTAAGLSGVLSAQLAVAVLGALAMTSEYRTCMIDISLTVVPRRARMLGAKVVVLAMALLCLGLVIALASFLGGQAVLTGLGAPTTDLTDPRAMVAVVGSAAFLAATGVIGLALGTLVRDMAGAVGVIVALVLLVRILTNLLPDAAQRWMAAYWPISAGERVITTVPDPALLAPLPGLALLVGFAVACLGGAFVAFTLRDA